MPRPERLVPATLVVLLALAAWVAPPTGASPTAREVTRTILPSLPDADPTRGTGASDIDNHGRITGQSEYRPVLWQDGEVVELTGFPDDVVIQLGSKVNDRGQVVAAGSTVVSGDLVYYLWQDGRVPTRIELGGGRRASQFFDLNERGQALVAGVDADGRFVVGLWQDGTFTEVAPWSYGVVPPADLAAWRFAQVPMLSNGGHVAGQDPGRVPAVPAVHGRQLRVAVGRLARRCGHRAARRQWRHVRREQPGRRRRRGTAVRRRGVARRPAQPARHGAARHQRPGSGRR